MISTTIEISLMITATHLLFQQGMLLGWFRIMCANMFDWLLGLKISTYVQKPLWECLPCMAGLWTIILTFSIDVRLILLVCGINILIETTFLNEEVPGK